MKFVIALMLLSFTVSAFAYEEFETFDEISNEEEIFHEMLLACVASKNECKTMAHHQGYQFLKVVTDTARCPQRPKIKACIVQH